MSHSVSVSSGPVILWVLFQQGMEKKKSLWIPAVTDRDHVCYLAWSGSSMYWLELLALGCSLPGCAVPLPAPAQLQLEKQ